MKKARILEIIRKSPKFPNPPARVLELINLSFKQTVDENAVYPLLTYHRDDIIEFAKHNFFTTEAKETNFRQIVLSMDPKDLRNILFTLWLMGFKSAGLYDASDYFFLQQYWVLSGTFAYTLGQFLRIGNPSDLFLQSMMQDISKLALARAVPDIYKRLQRIPTNAPHLESDESTFSGICHADISAEIAGSWEFPGEFVEPIRIHHQIEENPAMPSSDRSAAQIIAFSARLSELVIQVKNAYSYDELEAQFNQYFLRSTDEFPVFLRLALEKAKQFATPLGLRKMPNFKGLRVLKENPEFLKRKIIPYDDLLDELVMVYEQVETLERELDKKRSEAEKYMFRDMLTDLSNHAYFQEMLNQEVAKANRYKHPLSLIIFDLDKFRQFNQVYGIASGNAILQQTSDILKKNLRESDTIARYGGDEFAIIIPHAARVRATVVSEKLRRRIETHSFANPDKDQFHKLTISVGFATFDPEEDVIDKNVLLNQTLAGIHKARQMGGNRCESVDLVRSMSVNAR